HALAALPTTAWLASSLGLFFGGWVLQFIGHWYEGRKPAFVDDIVGLVIGPLFVAAEAGFLMGWRPEVQAAIEARVGPLCALSAQQRA
ncbi:Mpo1-like protein, partial [Acinetobacter baumannii]